jgi:predicted PurR-regulated permease PerM
MKTEDKQNAILNLSIALLTLTVIIIVAYFFIVFKYLIALIFTSLLVVFLMNPPILLLDKYLDNKTLSLVLVYLTLIAIFVTLGTIYIPDLIEQMEQLYDALPQLTYKLNIMINNFTYNYLGFKVTIPQTLSDLHSIIGDRGDAALNTAQNQASNIGEFILLTLTNSLSVMANFLLIFILSVFMNLEGSLIIREFLQLLTPNARMFFKGIIDKTDENLAKLIQGQFQIATLTSFVMLITYISLGNKYALLLALIQMLEVIPFIGTWLGILPALIVVLLVSGTTKFLIALIVYWIYSQLIRDQFITPKIIGDALGVRPLLMIISLVFSLKYYGVVGFIVVLPLAAIASAIISQYKDTHQHTNDKSYIY